MDAAAHCLDLVRRNDKDRFLAALFAPGDRRRGLFALYAFDIEIARIPASVSEAGLGEIRLQWWRETVEAVAAGAAVAHPVAQELGLALQSWRLPLPPFLALLAAHDFDLFDDTMPNLAALETYLGETSSAGIQLASLILAGDDARRSAEAAGLAGVALGLARLLHRHASGDARAGKFFPADLDAGAARTHAKRRLAEARALSATVAPAALPAFLPLSAADLYLANPARAPSQLRRQLRAWWLARRNRY